jgi:hypothetical protein
MPSASPTLSSPMSGGSPSPMGSASALGGGLNMGPQSDGFSGGLPGGAGGGGSQGMSQMLPMLLQIMSLLIQMMATLFGIQLPGQQPGGGGSGAPTPGGGGGIPSPPTPGGGGDTPAPTDDSPVPTGGDGGGGGNIQWDKAPENLKKLKPYIQKASKETGTPESIIAGVIWQESGGNVNVTATDGGSDAGLMQIDNTTYDSAVGGKHGLPHGKTPTDPANNIMAGAEYLAQMKKKFGTWDLAMRAYNSGENGVDRSNPNARPAGTGDPNYIISVRDHMKNLAAGTPLQNRG